MFWARPSSCCQLCGKISYLVAQPSIVLSTGISNWVLSEFMISWSSSFFSLPLGVLQGFSPDKSRCSKIVENYMLPFMRLIKKYKLVMYNKTDLHVVNQKYPHTILWEYSRQTGGVRDRHSFLMGKSKAGFRDCAECCRFLGEDVCLRLIAQPRPRLAARSRGFSSFVRTILNW